MEFNANEKEFTHLQNNPLTELSENGAHYILKPQRGCFLRCVDCFQLTQAESIEGEDGKWYWTNECLFCIQRAIDLLGWYEHKKVPHLVVSGQKKQNKRSLGGIYDAIYASVKADKGLKEDNPNDSLDLEASDD